MNAWKFILATFVIFGAGVILGGLVVDYSYHHRAKSVHRPAVMAATTAKPPSESKLIEVSKPRQPEILSQQFVQQLDDALQLTASQRVAIEKIIAVGQEDNHAIWTNCAAQSRLVLQEVRQHIREQLTPEQRKEFEKLLKQQGHPLLRRPATNAVPILTLPTNGPVILTTNIVLR